MTHTRTRRVRVGTVARFRGINEARVPAEHGCRDGIRERTVRGCLRSREGVRVDSTQARRDIRRGRAGASGSVTRPRANAPTTEIQRRRDHRVIAEPAVEFLAHDDDIGRAMMVAALFDVHAHRKRERRPRGHAVTFTGTGSIRLFIAGRDDVYGRVGRIELVEGLGALVYITGTRTGAAEAADIVVSGLEFERGPRGRIRRY